MHTYTKKQVAFCRKLLQLHALRRGLSTYRKGSALERLARSLCTGDPFAAVELSPEGLAWASQGASTPLSVVHHASAARRPRVSHYTKKRQAPPQQHLTTYEERLILGAGGEGFKRVIEG